jgi:hypothetical protein
MWPVFSRAITQPIRIANRRSGRLPSAKPTAGNLAPPQAEAKIYSHEIVIDRCALAKPYHANVTAFYQAQMRSG